MSLELNSPDELHLPPDWDYGLLPEDVTYDDDIEDSDEVFGYSSSIFWSKMCELFACSKSVLTQTFGKLGFIMILCLTWRLLYVLLVSVFHNPGRRTLFPVIILHAASIVQGILILFHVFGERSLLLLSLVISLASVFALHRPISLLSHRVGFRLFPFVVILLCGLVQLYGEFIMIPAHWHQVRGCAMITIMKAISFSSDLEHACMTSGKSHPAPLINSVWYRILAWSSYALCSATVIFGPWVEFTRFERLVSMPFDSNGANPPGTLFGSLLYQFFRSVKHGVQSAFIASFALVWSTCLSHILSMGVWRMRWMNAYVASQSFRFSHYFVSYASEAFLAILGVGYSIPHGDNGARSSVDGPIYVTRMMAVELPRSLVEVVVNWNLPMHTWLKYYVYKPIRPYGHIYAILATYTVSSLLHGMNFQLSAVLLSIGIFAYVEFGLRDVLANVLNCCIGSRRCRDDCPHINKDKNVSVRICNFAFTCLAIFHLAYLAVMFDSSEQQEHGYSMSHALRKWSDLGFVNHYVALATYLFYRCVL